MRIPKIVQGALGVFGILCLIALSSGTADYRSFVCILLGFVFGGLGCWGLYGIARSWMLARSSRSWLRTEGRVVSVDFKKLRGGSMGAGMQHVRFSPSYLPVVRYEYRVGGERFTGTRRDSSAMEIALEREEVEAFKQDWSVGKQVDVYYNPQNSSRAVLTPGAPDGHKTKVVLALCFCLAMAAIGSFMTYWGIGSFRWIGFGLTPAQRYHAIHGTPQQTERTKPQESTHLDGQGVPLGDPDAPSALKSIDLSGPWQLKPAGFDVVHDVEMHKTGDTVYEMTRSLAGGVLHIRGNQLVKQRKKDDFHWNVIWTWRDGHFVGTGEYMQGALLVRPDEETQPLENPLTDESDE